MPLTKIAETEACVFFGIGQSGVRGGQPSPQLCAFVQPLQGSPPAPPAVVHIEEIACVGKKRPNTRSGFSNKQEERTLNQFLWKWVGRVSRTTSQLRRPPTKPTLLTILRPGPLDQVFIHLSTPWERQEVCRQCLKRLAPTWAHCVHRQCLSAAIPAQHSRVLYGTLAGSSGKISRPKRVFPPVPHAVQCC